VSFRYVFPGDVESEGDIVSYSGFVVAVLSLLMAGSGLARAAGEASEVSADTFMPGAYNQVSVSFPEGVRGLPGVVYWTPVGYRSQTLDLYLPPVAMAKPVTGFPVVVFIHGERTRQRTVGFGSLSGFTEVLSSLAARGYVVAALNYRSASEARFPAQIQDIKAGLRWLHANAARFDMDSRRVLTWGVSAGGHLAALAAVSCQSGHFEPGRYSAGQGSVENCVRGAVAWDGIFDFATLAAQAEASGLRSHDSGGGDDRQFLGCPAGSCMTQMNAASPMTYVNQYSPPMLLIAGDADTAVPYQQTRQMGDCLHSAGVSGEVHLLPGIDHGLVGDSAEATRKAGAYAVERTFGFIDETLRLTVAATTPAVTHP
jgi:acetyl esterase/lipase